MKYIEILRIIVSMMPALIDLIKASEAAFPAGGQGVAKLEMVRVILQQAYDLSNDKLGKFDDIWPVVAKTISALVDAFNKLGTFNKPA